METTSSALSNLTSGRAQFRAVDLVLPSSWRVSSCQPGRLVVSAGGQVGRDPDIVIGDPHPSLGSSPWTLQTLGCGRQGEHVKLPVTFLNQEVGTREDRGT